MDFIPAAGPLAAFTLAAIVLAITPGPDMTLFVGRTLAQGKRAGVAAFAGACTGSMVHTTLAALGLSALLAASPTAFTVLKLAGALYLAWLAVQAIRHGSSFNLDAALDRDRSIGANVLTGIGINLLNPKIILFFVTFLPTFISASDPHAAGKLFFLGFYFILVSAPICIGIIFVASRVATTLKRQPRVMRTIDYVFASVFSGFAVSILLTPSR
ncbi:LysE family translocator [Aureimonas leprariae]|uniref:LysE family translocator n=1 Tax=Plantimonas leprariae TaxID=2615207 RepID=A0A7V7PRD3_9HYPH|nr:LysE family translocator [Aureimonas leprariae]KAB0681225.1 LysE family translocator [Aureimonas leprariae]